MNTQDKRAEEFMKCLGNGKSIYECEAENEMIDEILKEQSK